MSQIDFKPLSLGAGAVFKQLFRNGPTWDGDIIDKEGRSQLIREGLAFRVNGWTSLTQDGLEVAVDTPFADQKIQGKL